MDRPVDAPGRARILCGYRDGGSRIVAHGEAQHARGWGRASARRGACAARVNECARMPDRASTLFASLIAKHVATCVDP